jgi:hypothetical protein
MPRVLLRENQGRTAQGYAAIDDIDRQSLETSTRSIGLETKRLRAPLEDRTVQICRTRIYRGVESLASEAPTKTNSAPPLDVDSSNHVEQT